jgi:GNAT superfamily N-acetyltransferase
MTGIHTISIRTANLADLDFIVQAQLQMAEETEGLILHTDTVRAGVEHVFGHPDLGFYLLAQHSDLRIACLLILKEWSDWRNGEVWWIHSLFVRPEERQRGVFKAMYQWLRDHVEADEKLRGIRLYVDNRNKNAMKAYLEVGMDPNHYTLFEWLKPGSDQKK